MSAQTTLLFLIQVLVAIFANPDGAPLPACFDMIPQHGENKPSSGSVGAIIEVNNTDTKDLYAVTVRGWARNGWPNFTLLLFVYT